MFLKSSSHQHSVFAVRPKHVGVFSGCQMAFIAKMQPEQLYHSALEFKIALSTDAQEHYLLLSTPDSCHIMFYVAQYSQDRILGYLLTNKQFINSPSTTLLLTQQLLNQIQIQRVFCSWTEHSNTVLQVTAINCMEVKQFQWRIIQNIKISYIHIQTANL